MNSHSQKMTYMGLLLLKLQAVELESRTESRLIANWKKYSKKNCPRNGSEQLPPVNS